MAEECFWAAGEYSGQAAPMKRNATVPDRIDPTVEAMQMPGGYRPLNGPTRIVQPGFELSNRDDPVLPLRQFRQR